MKHLRIFIIAALAIVFQNAFALDITPTPPWKNESELGVIKTSGNTDSETYTVKQRTTHAFDSNLLTLGGRYLEAKTSDVQTAKSWEAALRYERVLSDLWSIFIQQGAESDPYAGYTQRDNTDVGGKYKIINSETENFFSELGYRYTKTLSSQTADVRYESFGRLYLEYDRKFNTSVSGKFWVEYLPNFTRSEAYLVNYEPSVTVMMTSIVSLKVAYLVKFHNLTVTPAERKEDSTFSTSLVAKF